MKKMIGGVLSTISCVSALCAADPFPALKDISHDILYPPNAKLSVDRDGNYVVNGKIRYLFGAQIGQNAMSIDMAPTPGYPAELKWLYEEPFTYENMQRAGLDGFALFISAREWLAKYRPEVARKSKFGLGEKDREYLRIFSTNGLPVLVDYTCFPWTFGSLAGKKYAGALPEKLLNLYINTGNNHWVPYNIFNPDGQKIYLEYWKQGIEDMKKFPAMKKFIYELFNEPAYDDYSEYNRKAFATFLEKKYKTPAKMSEVWNHRYLSFEKAAQFKRVNECGGLFVDWTKFMESGMTELARLGAETIRENAPGALVCYQILGMDRYRSLPSTNVNIYEISKHLNAISLPTGGGLVPSTGITSEPEHTVEAPSGTALAEGILCSKFFRSIADGKPIHNPECYARKDRQGNRNVLWQDMLRGSNATYMFLWGKRAWDWKPHKTARGGRASAEQFSYYLTNPYAYSAEALAGFMDAKKEVFRFGNIFMSRDNGIRPETAILISFPTERIAPQTGNVVKNEILNYASALEFSHYPWKAVVEEELAKQTSSESGLRAMVAAGIRNTYPGTVATLEKFVSNGGVLIVARDFLSSDEYEHPVKSALFDGIESEVNDSAVLSELIFKGKLSRSKLLPGRIMVSNTRKITSSAGWEKLAEVGSDPAILRRKFGKGVIYLVTPRMQDYAVAAVVGSILSTHGITPTLEITRIPQGDLAVNIECHPVSRNGMMFAHLMNLDNYPKRISVRMPKGASIAADLLSNELLPIRDGRAEIVLGTNAYVVVGFSSKASALEKNYGKLIPVTAETLAKRHDDADKARLAELKKKNAESFRYHVDTAMTTPLNLRPFANTGFIDKIAGNGKGGWTDQGADNSLTGTPWEVTPLLGVPCDFIRFDQNNDKTCIVLRSTSMVRKMEESVRGIPVNAKVRSLYFFHTTAWSGAKAKVMDYVIHYASGKVVTIPIVTGENIGDWWLHSQNKMRERVAWKNSTGRGFYIFDWRNPDPEDPVQTIDIVSASQKSIPIVIGITAERISPSAHEINAENFKIHTWGGCKAIRTFNGVHVIINEKTSPWAGIQFRSEKPFPLTEDQLKNAVLKFEINGGTDPFGNYRGGQKLQMNLSLRYKGVGPHVFPPHPDDKKDTFQPVEIQMKRFFQKGPMKIPDGITFQFYGTGAHAGFELRNLRIEYK